MRNCYSLLEELDALHYFLYILKFIYDVRVTIFTRKLRAVSVIMDLCLLSYQNYFGFDLPSPCPFLQKRIIRISVNIGNSTVPRKMYMTRAAHIRIQLYDREAFDRASFNNSWRCCVLACPILMGTWSNAATDMARIACAIQLIAHYLCPFLPLFAAT